MPRLSPRLFRNASRISPDLATLLPACRDLRSAANELRWIKEHVNDTTNPDGRRRRVTQLCHRRGRCEPLQYVLGSQPFGALDIKCKPQVLIPRPETEAYVCHLVTLLKSGTLFNEVAATGDELKIIDFCTGTGCIPLLLYSELQGSVRQLDVRGVDVSSHALRLAQENVAHNVKLGNFTPSSNHQQLSFERADVFKDDDLQTIDVDHCDILISNPPYVSNDIWNHGRGDLGYSVRKYEPRLALVPGDHLPKAPLGLQAEDVFYARLLQLATRLKPKVLLLEIGDSGQAHRVLKYAAQHRYYKGSSIELWRDWPDLEPCEGEARFVENSMEELGQEVPIKGNGNLRSIFIRTQLQGR